MIMLVELDVNVFYSVGGTFEIPDELAEQLDYGKVAPSSSLAEWLSDHIKEEDAMDWKYNITCFNEVKE